MRQTEACIGASGGRAACIACFRPKLVEKVREDGYFEYRWEVQRPAGAELGGCRDMNDERFVKEMTERLERERGGLRNEMRVGFARIEARFDRQEAELDRQAAEIEEYLKDL